MASGPWAAHDRAARADRPQDGAPLRRRRLRTRTLGLKRGDPEDKLTDGFIAEVLEAGKPGRPPGDRGAAWQPLKEHRQFIEERLEKKLKLIKIHRQFVRFAGHPVAYRTFVRFCHDELGHHKDNTTVRVADCEPGHELQVDFGRMGLLFDLVTGRRRVCHALILTAVYSRHMFVWLTFQQRLEDVIAGFEAGWAFFDGTFRVVVPDNIKAIVDYADAIDPRLNNAFIEYAQDRGFVIVTVPKTRSRLPPPGKQELTAGASDRSAAWARLEKRYRKKLERNAFVLLRASNRFRRKRRLHTLRRLGGRCHPLGVRCFSKR